MALEKELATYESKLPVLLRDEGKFVLIHADQIAGIFDTYQAALQAGYEKFGLTAFLVKRVEWAETVHTFNRDIHLCRQ